MNNRDNLQFWKDHLEYGQQELEKLKTGQKTQVTLRSTQVGPEQDIQELIDRCEKEISRLNAAPGHKTPTP